MLVSNTYKTLAALPPDARIGTGSAQQVAAFISSAALADFDIRGNVDTRLRKLDDGEYDAIILAEAGLQRLGLEGASRK